MLIRIQQSAESARWRLWIEGGIKGADCRGGLQGRGIAKQSISDVDRVRSRVNAGENAVMRGHCLDRQLVPGLVKHYPALRAPGALIVFWERGRGIAKQSISAVNRVRSRVNAGENAVMRGHCLDRQLVPGLVKHYPALRAPGALIVFWERGGGIAKQWTRRCGSRLKPRQCW